MENQRKSRFNFQNNEKIRGYNKEYLSQCLTSLGSDLEQRMKNINSIYKKLNFQLKCLKINYSKNK